MTPSELQTSLARTLVMGVVNVTPDSFYAASRRPTPEHAIAHALTLVEAGADLLDIGGESTRPGAEPVSGEQECERVLPVIEALAKRVPTPLSVDTSKASVAREALAAGAAMVNDVSGLRFDPELGPTVAASDAELVVMHMRGTPRTMQQAPHYHDVLAEVEAELEAAVQRASHAGVRPERVWIDPGIGFGKRLEDNLRLVAGLDHLRRRLARPLLLGTSRKSFIGAVLGLDDPDQRLEGSLASAAIGAWLGADAVRVHDVAATRRVVQMVAALRAAREQLPARPEEQPWSA